MGLLCVLGACGLLIWSCGTERKRYQDARFKLVGQLGTDNLLQLLTPPIPAKDNFFAIPTLNPAQRRREHSTLFWPDHVPKPQLKRHGVGKDEIDFEDWARKRGLPSSQAPAALDKLLASENPLLTELIHASQRGYSQLIPTYHASLTASSLDPSVAAAASTKGFHEGLVNLCLHCRVAAHAGNAAKARQLVPVILRWIQAANQGDDLLLGIVATSGNAEVFSTLRDVICTGSLDRSTLTSIQTELSKHDDIQVFLRGVKVNALALLFAMEHQRALETEKLALRPIKALCMRGYCSLFYDPNMTFWCESWSSVLAQARFDIDEAAKAFTTVNDTIHNATALDALNPRVKLAYMAFPNFSSSIWTQAADNLFSRYCLIFATHVEQFFAENGYYPSSLSQLPQFSGLPSEIATEPIKLNYLNTGHSYVVSTSWRASLQRRLQWERRITSPLPNAQQQALIAPP